MLPIARDAKTALENPTLLTASIPDSERGRYVEQFWAKVTERESGPVADDQQSPAYRYAAKQYLFAKQFRENAEREERRRQQAEFQARLDEQAKQARQQAATVPRIAPTTVVIRDRARRSPSRSAASSPPRSDDPPPASSRPTAPVSRAA